MSKYMTIANWSDIKHFKPTDIGWGDWRKIESRVIYMLETLRVKIATPIIVTSGSAGKHSPNSYHYQGLAIDCMFPNKLMPDGPAIAQAAEEVGFSGIGLYCEWELHGVKTLGAHFDCRPGRVKKWIGTDKQYLPATETNLKRYFLGVV